MGIPDFTHGGVLPQGVHLASMDEVDERFGTPTAERRDLISRLRHVHRIAELCGLNRIVLGGSFVTSKPAPNDIDGVILGAHHADWETMLPLISRGAQGSYFPRLALFPATTAQMLDYFSHTFKLARSGGQQGLLEIPILAPPLTRILLNPYISDELLDAQIRFLTAEERQTDSAVLKEAARTMLRELNEEKEQKSASAFFEQCMRMELSMPSEHGVGDVQINSLVGLINADATVVTVIDYGCGQGRLISELATLDPSQLAKLTYVGVDFDPSRAEQTALSLRFDQRCRRISFYNFEEIALSQGLGNYVLMVNVLHEVPLHQLPALLYQAQKLVKDGGELIIHDMEEIAGGERDFVPWSGEEVSTLFQGSGATPNLRTHRSKRGVPLYTLRIRVRNQAVQSLAELGRRARAVYRSKELRLIDERRGLTNDPTNSRLYAYLSVAIANIRQQLADAEVIRS